MGPALDTKRQAFGIILTLADDGWGSNFSYEFLAIIVALVAMSALGHKPTYAVQKGHVRFTPESGHKRCKMRYPLWANSGHRRPMPPLLNHRHTINFDIERAGERRDVQEDARWGLT